MRLTRRCQHELRWLHSTLTVVLVLSTLAFLGTRPAAAQGNLIELSLGGDSSTPLRINNNGQVAGVSRLPASFTQHGFFYPGTHGTGVDLSLSAGGDVFVNDINRDGKVVGQAYTTAGDSRAFRFDP